VLRYRFNAVKASVVMDTWPKMLALCFPNMKGKLNKEDWFYEFENGSQVWFGGLDEKERTEKILGQEYATIFFNECSQIPWNSIQLAQTRLAQRCEIKGVEGADDYLPLKFYYDENPPDKNHWSYRLFKLQIDPENRKALTNPADYGCLLMNPQDNRENLADEYIKTLGYLLEDLTLKAGPATWGRVVVDAYERHEADIIVAEINYGGAMVKQVIKSTKPNLPYKELRASRGKVARAEPISALVERGQVRLVGYFPQLEEELGGFTTNGFIGGASPNRADAFMWGMSELFPGIVEKRREKKDLSALMQTAPMPFSFV
jgi:hypothetical protein